MTQLLILALDDATGRHGRRELALADAWATDELAGRTVWCRPALADRLRSPGIGAAALDEGAGLAQVATLGRDDVVVLHDAATAPLGLAAREHGAHVVWHLDGPLVGGDRRSRRGFLHAADASADSYVMAWTATAGHGRRVRRIVSVLPHADVVAAVELPADAAEPRRRRAFGCVLAETVHSGRVEHVGGRVHARPAVAAR